MFSQLGLRLGSRLNQSLRERAEQLAGLALLGLAILLVVEQVAEKDKGSHSACHSQCAKFWPPLLTTGKPVAGAGARAGLLGPTRRSNGTTQVPYAGHPLYLFLEQGPSETN